MRLSQELDLDLPLQDVNHESVLSIVRTATLLAAAGNVLFRQYDLTEAQFNVLFALKYKDRDLTQSDLGKRLVVTRASITSVLDKLEAKGLVKRNEVRGNRRIYHVTLTARGRGLIDQIEPPYRQELERVMNGLDEKEQRTLIEMLERVRGQIVASQDDLEA